MMIVLNETTKQQGIKVQEYPGAPIGYTMLFQRLVVRDVARFHILYLYF